MENIFVELEERDILSRMCERALLLGVRYPEDPPGTAESHLAELEGLVLTLGISVVSTVAVPLRKRNPRWLLGTGKVDEIGDEIRQKGADLVVFDDDLSPAQQRNLEKEWKIAVIDRREVIIDIFADRATTREAVLQVALARMRYSLPRLTRAWTHLSRQRGGARGTRGKGETQLETDRRLVLDKIARLKRDLGKVREQRDVRRKRRRDKPVPSVSIVGYTNAGKSSLLNALSGSDVAAEDKLFATLDPTTRRIVFEGGREVVVTDTVGFIRKLPHDLMEAFHSTLEEAVTADVILHVVDAVNQESTEHMKVTEEVLSSLGAGAKPRLLVMNKVDALGEEEIGILRSLYPESIPVSAHTGRGLDDLRMRMIRVLDSTRPPSILLIPPNRWDLRSRLHRDATVLEETYSDDGARIVARLSEEDRGRLSSFMIEA